MPLFSDNSTPYKPPSIPAELNRSRCLFDQENNAADLAVVGLGPGGLMTALMAARSGRKVVAFTNRIHYIRGQRLFLSQDTIAALQQLYDPNDDKDKEFWKKYHAEHKTTQTKDLEKYLYRKLIKEPNAAIVRLNEPETLQSIGQTANKRANFIKTTEGVQYYFKNLVAADGAHHKTADLIGSIDYKTLNADGKLETTLKAKSTIRKFTQEKPRYHAFVQLQLKPGARIGSQAKKTITERMGNWLQQGWNYCFQPKFYILTNENKTKFYFTGEIPEKIFTTEDEVEKANLLKEWAALCISTEHGIASDQLEFCRPSKKHEAKSRLRAMTFEVNLKKASQTVVDLDNGVFVQIGDARRTPHYIIGNGANDAMQGGIKFVECLNNRKGFDKAGFDARIKRMDADIESKMRVMNCREELNMTAGALKLINATDQLIARMARQPQVNKDSIDQLTQAKQQILNNDLSAMYDLMSSMQFTHKNTAIHYRAYRYLMSFVNARFALTHSQAIMEDMKEHMEECTGRYYVPL